MLARMDMLSKIRRTQIYHNTTEAVLKYVYNQYFEFLISNSRTDHYSRITFPAAFLVLNCIYYVYINYAS